ncbi:MAG TPA: EAL domain-containing response regulator [Rhizobiaceae bacterium]|nr:EAL domain-containing response regulator [Rhizobiaceae bacterium]
MSDCQPILVVDDDPIFLAIARSVVTAIGCTRVFTARDGQEGIAAFENADLREGTVFLDLNMPNLDGLGFLRQLSALHFRGEVVLASGESSAILNSARHLAGMLGIHVAGSLKKPLKPDDVRNVLLSAAQERAARERAEREKRQLRAKPQSITPWYQPQFDAVTSRLFGAEALTRIVMSDGAEVPPGTLFEEARARGDLDALTIEIADRVFADMLAWRMLGLTTRVAVNVDAHVFEAPGFSEMLKERVTALGITPESVCLELTESALPRDMGRLVEALTRLRMARFHVSLDDYGAGSANYEMLRVGPFSEVKIDRSIAIKVGEDALAARFVELAVQIGAELDMFVIAEGVETEAQLARLRKLGVRYFQGYLFGAPMPRDRFADLMREDERALSA